MNTLGLYRKTNTFQLGQLLLNRVAVESNKHVTNTFGLHRCVNTFGVLKCANDDKAVINHGAGSYIGRSYEDEDNEAIRQNRIKQDDGDILEIISVLFKIGKL